MLCTRVEVSYRLRGREAFKGLRAWSQGSTKADYAYKSQNAPVDGPNRSSSGSAAHGASFLGWHKYYHFRVCYRDLFADFLREMLLDSRTLSRPYWQKNNLEAMLQHHIKGDRNYTNEIHRVLSLELAHRLFLDPR